MNRHALICRMVWEIPEITQREIALGLNSSLGTANRLIHECMELTYIEAVGGNYHLTPAGEEYLKGFSVDNAIIIAAGFGSRFVPLTFETPKGLLEVFGERMIERQILQLHQAGIHDVTIVVGYLKEKFDYLIDKYDVKLLYNPEYSTKNTLTTLYYARHLLKNTYLLSSDNWLRENMYHAYEPGSWYSSIYMEGDTGEWCITPDKKGRITKASIGGKDSWVMYGPAFFNKALSERLSTYFEEYYHRPGTESFYWEQVIMEHCGDLPIYINKQTGDQVYEFENLEELRLFDKKYQTHSDNEALACVASVFGIPESKIIDIRCLKSGMTNKSFLFQVDEKHYICRIPGLGTEMLINRQQEKEVYDVVAHLGITEHIIYFNGETGYKIAKFYEGSRNCNPRDWNDVKLTIELLHKLHKCNAKVKHHFDIRERICFYEQLCIKQDCIYFEDYNKVRQKMNWLMDRLDTFNLPSSLSHIDSVADNFLFLPNGTVRLIDWEYSGMCDPLMDIGMCAIYSYYNEEEVEKLLQIYFQRTATAKELFRIYSYIALGGFLWTLWAIYKSSLGDEFGEYTLTMYRYSKDYYKKCFKISNELTNDGSGVQ